MHPISPTSNAVSPSNKMASPLPMTPTSPESGSDDNDIDEVG